MERVLLFSLTAMANPTLLAATTLMLLLPEPKRFMSGYLLGAMTVSVTLGIVIVSTLQGAGVVDTAEHTANPAADLVFGGLLLVLAAALKSGRPTRLRERRRAHATSGPAKEPPRWQRAIGRGSPRTAFVVGMLLTLPGASYLAALTGIAKLDTGTTESVLLVVGVNVIMLAFIELPLIGYAVAPKWTPAMVERAKGWFRRHGVQAAIVGATVIGSLLVARAVITLVS